MGGYREIQVSLQKEIFHVHFAKVALKRLSRGAFSGRGFMAGLGGAFLETISDLTEIASTGNVKRSTVRACVVVIFSVG
jgi:hypothetical protein